MQVPEQILRKAIDVFQEITGLSLELVECKNKPQVEASDAVLLLAQRRKFHTSIRKTVTTTDVGQIVTDIDRNKKPTILIAPYINPKVAEQLKGLGVQFIDDVGNAYINTSSSFVYITGRKPQKPIKQDKPLRAFRSTGLKVIFALLCNPQLVNASYREIADAAGVALGSVGWIVNELLNLGYIVESKSMGRTLVEKQKLIAEWVTAYPRELRPKLVYERYHAIESSWWKGDDWKSYPILASGETAASLMTKQLKPGHHTLYNFDEVTKFLNKFRLRKDPNGEIEILKSFWVVRDSNNREYIAEPLLVYADLMMTGDARNIEVAKVIYEKHLI